MMEDTIFAVRQLKILIFRDYKKRMRVRLFTDLEATLESIASLKQIERKTLRLTVTDLKERLVNGHIHSYSWIPTRSTWADMMTKEIELPSAVENVFLKNYIDLPKPLVNEVKTIGTEI